MKMQKPYEKNKGAKMKYRVYADGQVVHEDDFNEKDNSTPYYDDYQELDLPDELVEFIECAASET